MTLTFVNQTSHRMPRKYLSKWVNKIERQLKKRNIKIGDCFRDLTLVFVSQKKITELNYQYRNKKKPTDILSFSAPHSMSLGELVLCPQIIVKQSSEHKLSFREELGYMVLHGILHLLGFEHETSKKDAQKMLTLQDSIFETIRS